MKYKQIERIMLRSNMMNRMSFLWLTVKLSTIITRRDLGCELTLNV